MKTAHPRKCSFEHPSEQEGEQIADITKLTVQLLDQRYPEGQRILRGVHPKSHGCVKAIFKINEDIEQDLRVGLFAHKGKNFEAIVRFSNASILVKPDINDGKHGSRGMAIKILEVDGKVLLEDKGDHNQNFLMINQPSFVFANAEDYLRLDQIIFEDKDNATRFFAGVGELFQKPSEDLTEAESRLFTSFKLLQGIQNTAESEDANPVEIRYFSAAPFLFGKNKVMKFSAKPIINGKLTEFPAQPSDNYLREALAASLEKDEDIIFSFGIQVRPRNIKMTTTNQLIKKTLLTEKIPPIEKINFC
jgi:hypothetical protein